MYMMIYLVFPVLLTAYFCIAHTIQFLHRTLVFLRRKAMSSDVPEIKAQYSLFSVRLW